MNLPLFVYGSMRDEDVRAVVLGCAPPGVRTEPAWMHGVVAARVPGESYPFLVPAEGARAPGELIHGLDERCVSRILFFEGHEYELVECEAERADGARVAAAYFGGVEIARAPIVAWSLERWQAGEKPLFLEMAREYMAHWRRVSQDQAESVWQRLIREYGVNGREP